MRESGVCPLCGMTVNFYVADNRSRVCPNCGQLIDIDDIIEKEDQE